MKLDFEYGQGTVSAQLPDYTDVFIPGVTVPDPPCIPEDRLEEETLRSLRNPIGMPPLTELAKKGSKVTIVFPDRVKGGEQKTSHRKISIKLILKELYSVGVEKKDILLICSNGLHRKNTVKEIRNVLGDELFDEFWPTHQIINHDSEDWDHLVDLDTTEAGDPVIMNRYVYEADVAILIGHVQGNPYGGYSGGYKHCAEEHRKPPRAGSHAQERLHACIREIADEDEVQRDRHAYGEVHGQEVLLLRCRTRFQEQADQRLLRIREGDDADLMDRCRQEDIRPLG